MFKLPPPLSWLPLSRLPPGRRPGLATPARSILFVTTHCPTRAHAGGLRLLDLCIRLRAIAPNAAIDVFAHRNQAIDGDYADVEAVFDRVYYCERMRMNFARFRRRRPQRADYDVVSFEFLQHPSAVRSFLPHAGRALFTPMELLTRAHALAPEPEDRKARARARRELEREAAVCALVDEVVCVSRPDAEFARRRKMAARISCLETGVSQLEFHDARTDAAREPFTVVFVAFFDSRTNRDALQWYLDGAHVLLKARFPDYRLDVIGRGDLSAFRDRADAALRLVGEVDRLAPHIARAAAGIAPALSGAGFRGKINQYACCATPTVASPLAAEGLAYRDGESILVAQDPDAFAQALAGLLADPAARARMGARAAAVCDQHYSWASRDREIARIFNLG
jgi:glycosyltransferase involved in cell wall biosynthesis